jgi:hypothetical protein
MAWRAVLTVVVDDAEHQLPRARVRPHQQRVVDEVVVAEPLCIAVHRQAVRSQQQTPSSVSLDQCALPDRIQRVRVHAPLDWDWFARALTNSLCASDDCMN